MLLGDIAGFRRVLCLDGSHGGRPCLASGCRRRLLARGRVLPRRRAFVASCRPCCGGTSCRRALGIRNLGAALLSGTARKRCVLARCRSLSHGLGNALGALGPQLSRCVAKGHREGQECHQAALGYTACNRATAMQRGALALVLKHIHLSPIVCTRSVALRLPHVIAHVALEFPHRGPPFPPEPYAHRRHTLQPHARWEAIRLNLNGSGAPSDLRREHPEPRGITVTGTAGDLHPDSPKRAGKPRIRASPHHHLGHRLLPSKWYHAKGPRTQAKPKVKAIVCDRKCGDGRSL